MYTNKEVVISAGFHENVTDKIVYNVKNYIFVGYDINKLEFYDYDFIGEVYNVN